MKIKNFLLYVGVLSLSFVLFAFVLPEEKDFLNKRVFNVTFVEIKDGAAQKKTVADKLQFKNGKLFCGFFADKFGFKWIKYRIEKDSIYTDSTDTEVRYLDIEASATDENNQTIMMNFNILEWDIEGVVKITKNDKLKKHFDFVGREQGKKVKGKKNQPDKMYLEGQERDDGKK